MLTDLDSVSLDWDVPPLSCLSSTQQVKFKAQAKLYRYRLGEKIWSTDSGGVFLLVVGKVRLREEVPKSAGEIQLVDRSTPNKPLATLVVGDWFGSLQQSRNFKAVAASKEVVVVCWESSLWMEASTPELEQFWDQVRRRIEPQTVNNQSITGYPFVCSLNTAAACLTMATQQLHSSAPLLWVQRQLRGQRPKDVVEAGEKLGLQLRRLQTTWGELRQIRFPALLHWQQAS